MSSCDKSHADHDRTKITFPTVSICALALWLAVEPDGATLLTLLAALLHEAGHLITARALGIGVAEITLLPLGADIRFSRLPTYREDIITGAAGAAANLIRPTAPAADSALRRALFCLLEPRTRRNKSSPHPLARRRNGPARCALRPSARA